MSSTIVGSLLAFSGIIFSIWAIFKFVIIHEFRLEENTYKTLYEISKTNKIFVFKEEFVAENQPPIQLNALCLFKNCPTFYLNHSERLLTAGWQGKDTITTIHCLRWSKNKIKNFLKINLKSLQIQMGIPVELITPHYTDKIGTIKELSKEPIAEKTQWEDIDKEAAEVLHSLSRLKTSALLYGPPGNGKTQFVKYLATKYKVPIRIITFSPEFTNHHLMEMFSRIGSKCIVLFEDFDNYFDGRTCILGSGNNQIKFSFDIILNGLDGIYNTYENVMFIMTANKIEKIDYALKNRPSRFKYVREFKNPSDETKKNFLPENWIPHTKNFNLDQILRLKEFYEQKNNLQNALAKLEKNMEDKIIQEIAYQKYQLRMENNSEGSHEEDWHNAIKSIT